MRDPVLEMAGGLFGLCLIGLGWLLFIVLRQHVPGAEVECAVRACPPGLTATWFEHDKKCLCVVVPK